MLFISKKEATSKKKLGTSRETKERIIRQSKWGNYIYLHVEML